MTLKTHKIYSLNFFVFFKCPYVKLCRRTQNFHNFFFNLKLICIACNAYLQDVRNAVKRRKNAENAERIDF